MDLKQETSSRWSAAELAYVRDHFRQQTHKVMAAALGRTPLGVKTICRRHRFVTSRAWTEDQIANLRELHGTMTAKEIGVAIGRQTDAVENKIHKLGLGKKGIRHGSSLDDAIGEKHAIGMSDNEIAQALTAERGITVERHFVGERRKLLGLPSNNLHERRRNRVREKTREQLAAAGLPSMAHLRLKVWREKAAQLGWPTDLRPRSLQILNALYMNGPMTRREIADAIGMPWKGSRASLSSNDAEGSYLAHLVKRGLVVNLGRRNTVVGKGRGASTCVYTLPLHVQPQPQAMEVGHVG